MSDLTKINELIKTQRAFEEEKKQKFIVNLQRTKGTDSIIPHVELYGIPNYLYVHPELKQSIKSDNALHQYLLILDSDLVDPKTLVFSWSSGKVLIQKLK